MTDRGILSSALSRRTLLGMTAGVAGAVALPNLLTTSASAVPVGEVVQLAGAPDILTDDVFPIGFFWPPPARQTNDVRYGGIADAGFTMAFGGNDVWNKARNVKMLQMAGNHGLRVLPIDQRVSHAVPSPGWEDRLRAVLAEYLPYNAFAGFRIKDEPDQRDYPRFRMIADVLAAAAPTKLSHFNLVPIYDATRRSQYKTFLERYVEQIAPTFVSFDHYPLKKDGTTRPTFFLNHWMVRDAGLRANLPTWVYIQSVDHWEMRLPNYAELAWQINIALAYGCKGIQYFTYWTPEDAADFVFGTALIKKDGCQSQVYVDARDINRNHLQPVGGQLKHLKSVAVFHANETPPLEEVRFEAARSKVLTAVTGSPLVLGEFERSTDNGQSWVFAANRSFSANSTDTLTVKPAVTVVEEFNPATGAYIPVALSASRAFTASLAPGRARLYRLTRATGLATTSRNGAR